MNGWVLAIVVVLVLVVALRAWFRWFSRRPLSTVDHYAGAVDTVVDAAVHPEPAAAPVRPTPTRQPPVGPASTARSHPAARPVLPEQRTVADAGDAAPDLRTPAPPQQQAQ